MKTETPVRVFLWVLVILGAVCCSMAQAGQGSDSGRLLSGEVRGASGRHTVYVALWDVSGFLQKPVQQLKFAAGEKPSFQFHVVAGQWALSAYEDENGDGKLNMGMFGPKEPSGFWRPFHQWRKPRFADVSSLIEIDTRGADIDLHK